MSLRGGTALKNAVVMFDSIAPSRLTGPTPWWIIGWTFGPLVNSEIPKEDPQNIPQIPEVQISTGFLRP